MFNAAAVQMVSTDKLADNLEKARQLISEAVKNDVKLITLPENFPLMGQHDEDRLAINERYGADGPIQSFLSEQAKTHCIWLVGGTVPISSQYPDKVFASSLLYNPGGSCSARYDKIHLFDVMVEGNEQESYQESATFAAGSDVVVAQTEVGNIGLSVCYDLRFPELYRKMHSQHVQIITTPSAFTATTGAAHWQTLIRSRAVENLCYVISSNQGGLHPNGRETWGHSMIVNPWGEIIASLEKGDGIAVASIDLEKQEKLRQSFPSIQHRKLDYLH